MIEIEFPIVLIGDGNLIKYRNLEDAEQDLEAYDIDSYSVYDSSYRKLELYKKDKYYRVGFRIVDTKIKNEEVYEKIKEFARDYELSAYSSTNLISLIEEVPFH